jgi:hypothetical protein|nr:MAG TPA: helix-turn-helix domain protein [Caudoviricetes sp.]
MPSEDRKIEIEDSPYHDQLLTYKELMSMFHIGKGRAYELLHSSGFPTIRIGNRMYVSRRHLSEWLDTYKGRRYLL